MTAGEGAGGVGGRGGADVAILHQVWQVSDKAESPGSTPDAPVLLLLKSNAHLHQSVLQLYKH